MLEVSSRCGDLVRYGAADLMSEAIVSEDKISFAYNEKGGLWACQIKINGRSKKSLKYDWPF